MELFDAVLDWQNSIKGVAPEPGQEISLTSLYLSQEIVFQDMLNILRESNERLLFMNERTKTIENAFGIDYIATMGTEYTGFQNTEDAYTDTHQTIDGASGSRLGINFMEEELEND